MRIPWRAAFLTVSFLSFVFLPGQMLENTISITLNPPRPEEGQSVTLMPSTMPETVIMCSWYRGAVPDSTMLIIRYYPAFPDVWIKGNAYTGREKIRSNCSLFITHLLSIFSGNYTVTWDIPPNTYAGRAYVEITGRTKPGSPRRLTHGEVAGIFFGGVVLLLIITAQLVVLHIRMTLRAHRRENSHN